MLQDAACYTTVERRLTCFVSPAHSFPMKQGVLQAHRVRLLLSKGHSCYRPRRTGERVRKSVRGCIVGSDISVLAVAIVKQGDADIPGLTDTVLPKRLGPKRATKVGYIDMGKFGTPRDCAAWERVQRGSH